MDTGGTLAEKGRPSFLKKRSKRLLRIQVFVPLAREATASRRIER
jgi:hypothetical protein